MQTVRIVVSVLLGVSVAACDPGFCENEVIEDIYSKDLSHVVTVFDRSCAGPSPIVHVVAIRKAGDQFDPENHGDWLFTIHGQSEVHTEWIGQSRIHISFRDNGDQPTMRTEWNGIQVFYN